MRSFRKSVVQGLIGLLVAVLWLIPGLAQAAGLDIDRPGQREFVVDYADILDTAAEEEIREIAEKLLDEHATPIVLITIESMAEHGGQRMEIDTFARILFDQWGVGHPYINDAQWNTGILFVISEQDRKARIELGGGWAHDKDSEAETIMATRIIPAFKEGEHSRGAVAGVRALDAMARSKPLPLVQSFDLYLYLFYGCAALVLLLVLKSLISSGRSGWGWKFLVLGFTIFSGIMMWRERRRRRRCRGGRRGSFGGGQSGGGGATGSW